MPPCTSCSAEIPDGSRFCPSCGAQASSSPEGDPRTSAPTKVLSKPVPSHPSLDRGRFLPGAMLAGRYRVKAPALKPLFQRVRGLMARFDEVTTDHVPRELNARADELANAGSRKSKERMRKNAD